MIATKTIRFMMKYAASDPFKLADIIRRRAIEHFGRPSAKIVQTSFDGVQYEVDLSLHRVTKKYYYHTHEMFLERIFDRYLKLGQIFVDVGANCGYWSAYALSRVGKGGEVHAFEPVPQYFAFVRRLRELNPQYKVFANQLACGAEPGELRMTVVPPRAENFNNFDTNIGSSSLAAGFLDHAQKLTEQINVRVVPFDRYVDEHAIDLDRIGLIKIDVEGFEGLVFDGMRKVLEKGGRKIPILCEILTDTGRDDALDGRQIIARLTSCGYRCLNALDLRPVDGDRLGFEENILCV